MDASTEQLSNILFQVSNLMALPFEKNFKPDAAVQFAANNHIIPVVLVSAYLVFCYVGPKLLAGKKGYFDLTMPLAVWNAFLCLFSFLGMCRTVPYIFATILSSSFEQTVCTPPSESWGNGPCGFWVMLFVFSKIPELIDTVFIVLRNRPLIFLHWYHHVTVLLFCWNAYSTMAGSGLYFVAMNYTVHALMYGYYCLQALKMLPKSFPAILITVSQIAQMFVGTGVCISAWYFMLSGKSCHNDISNLTAGAVMYGSYLFLFTQFAFRRYSGKGKGSKNVAKSL